MIPTADDPKWRKILTSVDSYQFKSATAGMMFARLRRSVAADPSHRNLTKCIEEARIFLTKYQIVMQDEIESLFR